MPITIAGLDDFHLTVLAFRRLDGRRVVAQLGLSTYDVTPDVARRAPRARHVYLRERVSKWLQLLRRDFPDVDFQLNQPDPSERRRGRWFELPTQVAVHTTARRLLALSKARGVYHVYVSAIEGLRRQRKRRPHRTWYCVRARVAITIEGQVRGMQTIEDRFVVLRASSPDDATARLRPQWRKYATPYLNSSGQMVRWQLEKIVDVYRTDEDEIRPDGTEVYSSLSRRRLRGGGTRAAPSSR